MFEIITKMFVYFDQIVRDFDHNVWDLNRYIRDFDKNVWDFEQNHLDLDRYL